MGVPSLSVQFRHVICEGNQDQPCRLRSSTSWSSSSWLPHHYQQHHRRHQQVRKHHLSLRCWAPAAFYWPQIPVSPCLTLHKWFDWDQDGDDDEDGIRYDDDRDDVDENDHNCDNDSYDVAQAALHIQGVGRGDEGEYSCQVLTFWRNRNFYSFGWTW